MTGGLADDISVDQNTINLGNQLMFLGVIVLEIPSNLILYKVRAMVVYMWDVGCANYRRLVLAGGSVAKSLYLAWLPHCKSSFATELVSS